MNITSINRKIVPTALLIGATAVGNAIANNKVNVNEETNQSIEVQSEPQKKTDNTILWNLALLGVGAAIGVTGTKFTETLLEKYNYEKMKRQDESVYFSKRFVKDADKLYDYMQDVLTNVIANDLNEIDKMEFYNKTYFFTSKYPSRKDYVEKFAKAVEEKRLSVTQKETLCQYLISKATISSKEEQQDTSRLFPFLEGVDDYEKMVKEVKHRTVSASDVVKSPNSASGQETQTTEDGEESEIFFDTVHHNLKFNDVGGQDKAIEILKKNILFPIKYPDAFKNNSLNHGFLLYGPPGTGKTLISEVLANESDAHFIKLNGNDLTSKWVGETEENWRKLFQEAKGKQPTIILIDEFDSIAAKRGEGNTYNDKTVNQILGLISDLEKNNYQIYIIATTNRKDMIDSAILRPGRLGMHIELKAPQTIEEVIQILNIYLNKRPHVDNLDINKIAQELLDKKVTGADIAYIVNEAYEQAMNRNSIYEKMDNGSFNISDMESVCIISDDFENVINDFKTSDKKRTPIGYNK